MMVSYFKSEKTDIMVKVVLMDSVDLLHFSAFLRFQYSWAVMWSFSKRFWYFLGIHYFSYSLVSFSLSLSLFFDLSLFFSWCRLQYSLLETLLLTWIIDTWWLSVRILTFSSPYFPAFGKCFSRSGKYYNIKHVLCKNEAIWKSFAWKCYRMKRQCSWCTIFTEAKSEPP